MKTSSNTSKLIAMIALAVVSTVAFAQPAHADWRGHDGWHGHRYWHSQWHGHPGYYGEPGYPVYAPAPVVYAPPEPSPGINLIVPLHIR